MPEGDMELICGALATGRKSDCVVERMARSLPAEVALMVGSDGRLLGGIEATFSSKCSPACANPRVTPSAVIADDVGEIGRLMFTPARNCPELGSAGDTSS